MSVTKILGHTANALEEFSKNIDHQQRMIRESNKLQTSTREESEKKDFLIDLIESNLRLFNTQELGVVVEMLTKLTQKFANEQATSRESETLEQKNLRHFLDGRR